MQPWGRALGSWVWAQLEGLEKQGRGLRLGCVVCGKPLAVCERSGDRIRTEPWGRHQRGVSWVLSAVLELSPGQFPFPFSTGFTHFKPPVLYSQLMVSCLPRRNHLPGSQTHSAPLLTPRSPRVRSHMLLSLAGPSSCFLPLSPPMPRQHLPSEASCLIWSTPDSCEVTLSPSLIAALALGPPRLLQITTLGCLDLSLDFGILDPSLLYLLLPTAACHRDSLRSSQLRSVSSFAPPATNYRFSPHAVTSAS